MKDCTDFFTEAIKQGEEYCAEDVQLFLNAYDEIACEDDDDALEPNWLLLYRTDGYDCTDFYGYLSIQYPAAFLTAQCPQLLKEILQSQHILYTLLEEPMCCDAEILKRYAPQERYKVFNEDALVSGEISPDDERFQLVLYRLETGYKCYIDAGDFRLDEMNR